MKKQIDIKGMYGVELHNISRLLNKLEKGQYTEKTGIPAHGTVKENTQKLKGMLADLFVKIEYGKTSSARQMGEILSALVK